MGNSILKAEHIQKTFYENEAAKKKGSKEGAVTVLWDVSFEIKEGEFISVMGPSGSGKSTLLYAVSGMDCPEKGSVFLEGKDLAACTEEELTRIRREKIGFVFQQPSLLKNLNIIDNIALLSSMDLSESAKSSGKSREEARKEMLKKAERLMEMTGLSGLSEREISKVSGGQLQRAGICRALMRDPKILFADEPTGALNSKASEEIMDIFLKVNREGHTIMLVTHDAKVAAKSDKILFMKDGQIESILELGKYEKDEQLAERVRRVNAKMQGMEI